MSPLILAALLAAAPAAAAPAVPAEPAARLAAANAHYLEGEFEEAARGYGALVSEGYESPALHLNRGNALLRLGHRGQAIASYERALRLRPSDGDARANLELARAANVDRVVGAADRSFVDRLAERAPDGAATGLFVACWLGLWAALATRRRADRRGRAALGAAAIAAALLSIAAGGLLAAKALEARAPAAVVVTEVASVREGPSETLRAAFELHEGTRVRLLEARDGLVRIRLDNGLEGWIAERALDVI